MDKIREAGLRRRAEVFYQELDGLRVLHQAIRRDLLLESRKHCAAKLLREIPSMVALIQTPHRFRTKRQLWTYSGLWIETRDSAEYRFLKGHLQRCKKPMQIRGLNV